MAKLIYESLEELLEAMSGESGEITVLIDIKIQGGIVEVREQLRRLDQVADAKIIQGVRLQRDPHGPAARPAR